MDKFEQLLEGAYAMDEHFRCAPWRENIPVVMALLGVWYNNFFNIRSHALLPYDPSLQLLPAYLQQLDMESNGKGCTRDGAALNYATGPIVWGQLGMDSQHAFYQLLHQGTKVVPCDFLCAAQSEIKGYADHHRWLLANCMAQTKALMTGKTENEVRSELIAAGVSTAEVDQLAPHKVFLGNRPSNTILYKQLTPKVLGSLLALYEHRTFVQGVIWNVNSFDQWGVELGKTLAKDLNQQLMRGVTVENQDCSTNGLLNRCLDW
jgi:glucose-6-phosphate isomerase